MIRERAIVLIGFPLTLLSFFASGGCTDLNSPVVGGGGTTLGGSVGTDESIDGGNVIAVAGVNESGANDGIELTFKAGPVFCCNPLTIQFASELRGPDPFGNVTYDWDFGNGRGSEGENPKHTFPFRGDYIITLTATFGNNETRVATRILSLRRDAEAGDVISIAEIVNPDDDVLKPEDDEEEVVDEEVEIDDEPVVPVAPMIRAMYGPSDNEYLEPGMLVDNALDDGITDFVTKFGQLESPLGTYDRRSLDAWIQKLEAANGNLWVAINWAANPEMSWIDPIEAFVTADGVALPNTPCPTSQYYWRRSIAERGAALAALAIDYPTLRGMVVDVEMYHSEIRKYTDPSYSDSAFGPYLESLTPGVALPSAGQRYGWVLTHGGEQAYIDFQRELVRGLAASALAAIRAANPNFEVGGTGMVKDGEWFYDGFALGFGTAQRPLFEFAQRFYTSGYSSDVQTFQDSYRARGIYANVVVGLRLDNYPPDAFADHFYSGAIETAGVWIYDATEFADTTHSDNCETIEDYRNALRLANDEVNNYLADSAYVSTLSAGPFVPACSDELPVIPTTAYVPLEGGPIATEELRIRRQLTYFFYATAGDAISFDLTIRRITDEYLTGWWVLKGPDETPINSGAWTPESNPAQVRATATQTGLYALVVDPDWRFPVSIKNPSHPGSYTGGEDDGRLRVFGAHLLQRPQLLAYVPPGVTSIGITVVAPVGEQTNVSIFDERDRTVALFSATPAGTIDADFLLVLPNEPGGNGVVLEINLENAGNAEDFEIEFRSGALPFLSQTRSGLFSQP